MRAALLALFAALIVLVALSTPAKSQKIPYVVVGEFIPHNPIVEWAQVYMRLIANAFPAFSPPAIGRLLAVVTTGMYDAWTAYDNTALPVYEENERSVSGTPDDQTTAALYASFCVLYDKFWVTMLQNQVVDEWTSLGYTFDVTTVDDSPIGVGNAACKVILQKRAMDGFNEFGNEPGSIPNPDGTPRPYSDYTGFFSVNPPQDIVTITTCSKIRSWFHWQPLLVELGPLPSWSDGAVQGWLGIGVGNSDTFAPENREMDGFFPAGPPRLSLNVLQRTNSNATAVAEAEEVLSWSGQLNDTLKVIAEFWADGPVTSLPPGHWHTIAIDTAIQQQLTVERCIKLMFLQAQAVMDAGIACWRVKRWYNSMRPITEIQCLHQNEMVNAWRGPYMGIGLRNGSTWLPYQNKYFITPPFAGYISGHSSFSAASAEVISSYLGSDQYLGPTYVAPEGASLFEPKIDSGADWIPGVTDVANTGPGSIGYSPSQNITLRWNTLTEAANQAGISRLYGGIHVNADNVDGLALGREIGRNVYALSDALFNGNRPTNGLCSSAAQVLVLLPLLCLIALLQALLL